MKKLPEEGIVKLLIHCLTEAPCTHIHENPHCTQQSESPSALGKMPKPSLHPNSLPGPSNTNKSIQGRKKVQDKEYIPTRFPGFFTLLWKFLTHHTLVSVAEELSIPFWVGELTCVLWQVPHVCCPWQCRNRGPGSSAPVAFLSHSAVSQRVSVERRNHPGVWGISPVALRWALWNSQTQGVLSSLPRPSVMQNSCVLPAEQAGSFLLQVQLSEGSFLFQHPLTGYIYIDTDWHIPLTRRSTWILKPLNTKYQPYLIVNMKPTSERKWYGRHRWNVPGCIRDFCILVLCYPLFMARFLIFLWDKWAKERDSEGME